MSYIITKDLTDFANDVVHPEALIQEIGANETITTTLERVRENNGTVEMWFESEPSAGEETEVDSVVAAHQGTPPLKFHYHTSSTLIEDKKSITEDQDWQDMGGVVTTLGSFMSDASKAWGRIIGQAKVSGSGAELVVHRCSDETALGSVYQLSDTSGEWVNVQFWANQNQPAGTDRFCLCGRLNGATSVELRSFSMSLLEKLE
jgi:hypothetical protein